MSYSLDFNRLPNSSLLNLSRYTKVYTHIMNGDTVQDIANYIFNKDNNFFKYMEELFANLNTADMVRSIRFFPFKFEDYFDLDLVENSAYKFGDVPISSIIGSSEIYQIDDRFDENVVLLADFTVPEFEDTDSYLNYEPYTKLILYLPFYNQMITLDRKRIKTNKLFIHGALDVHNGDMLYILTTDHSEFLGTYQAHITVDIDLFSQDTKQYLKNIAGHISSLAGTLMTNPQGAFMPALNLATQPIGLQQALKGGSDTYSPLYSPLSPTLLIYKPKVKYSLNDTNYNHLKGIPCKKIARLGTMGGYTVVGKIHSSSFTGATENEIKEIEDLLKNGVRLDNTNATFSVSFVSSNATWSIQPTEVEFGRGFTTAYTINSGYEFSSIKVTMGGIDITNTAVIGNVINITNATGNVVIKLETAKIPVTYTVTYSGLTGATLSNLEVAVNEGSNYITRVIPLYNNGYVLGNFVPTITTDGMPICNAYDNGVITINNVQGDIVITGTLEQVTTMTDRWIPRVSYELTTPLEAIELTGVTMFVEDGVSQYYGEDVVIDNVVNEIRDNSFMEWTYGQDDYHVSINNHVYENDVDKGVITYFGFNSPNESYTSFSGLLEWLDKNFVVE